MRIVISMLIVILITASCSRGQDEPETYEPVVKNHLGLGTVSRITVYDLPQERAEALINEVFARIDEIDRNMSLFREQNDIAQINQHAGDAPVTVSKETYQVISEGIRIARSSGGAFDPTIGPLVAAWGIGTDDPRIPPRQELQELLSLVDYRKVQLGDDFSVGLASPDMAIDLGGIAKGYAADEAKRILSEGGSSSALINLGGNIMLLGTKPDSTPWRIGIQDPNDSRGRYTLILSLTSGTVVTSGVYERFFYDEDIRYHHILDTGTGYPAENGLESVTIVTEQSAYADGLSTAAFVMGLEAGLEYINSLPDAEAVFITADREIYFTEGFGHGKIPYTISDDRFEVVTR